MHDTAMELGQKFFETYLAGATGLTIVDIGSQDVNGSLRSVAPPGNTYVGVDFAEAKGVDVVLTDPYKLPFEDNYADVCVSANCFEHSEFFWLSFLEVIRILKPGGLFFLDVPANGAFHRYPVDCWRFYPDSGMALRNWARRNGYNTGLLESFVGDQKQMMMNDFVAVFLKDESLADRHPNRMLNSYQSFTNGYARGATKFLKFQAETEDRRAHMKLREMVGAFQKILKG